MTCWIKKILIIVMYAMIYNKCISQNRNQLVFQWDQLPQIPDPIGFAGSFAGVSNNALIVAGGANFPDGGAPWTKSTKRWYDRIFVLERCKNAWEEVGKLPIPLGYGLSVTWKENLICVGGSSESGHHQEVFSLTYKEGKINIKHLAPLPKSLANTSGALIGDILYLAGGAISPDSKTAESVFWSLDLSTENSRWKDHPSWPGPPRMLSVAGSHQGDFYLFSGVSLKNGQREYLKDAYRYKPGEGWLQLTDLPKSVAAAPGTAVAFKDRLLVFGGDDGRYAAVASEIRESHPGFSSDILAYNVSSKSWHIVGQIVKSIKETSEKKHEKSIWAPVTTALVVWNDAIILPGGEVRPAVRTSRVLRAVISEQ